MKRSFLFAATSLAFLPILGGCVSAQERFARRINCDVKDTAITSTTEVVAYTAISGTCKQVRYTCRDAPFWSSCKPDSEWSSEKLKNDKKK